jgi:glucose-1-phosphate thymidylyltransferase
MDETESVIALIPAAGRGIRLGQLPCSKELLPISLTPETATTGRIQTAIENAIATLVANDITTHHVIIAPGKWDIPAYLGNGSRLKTSISYLIAESSPSVPHSLDHAYQFVGISDVVLVFPDIIFRPRDAVRHIVNYRIRKGADAALALVPSNRGDKVDIVKCGPEGTVLDIHPKPGSGHSGWTWTAAVWSRRFTEFLHEHLGRLGRLSASDTDRELYVADVLNDAIRQGLVVDSVKFVDGDALDIGTAEDLVLVWR